VGTRPHTHSDRPAAREGLGRTDRHRHQPHAWPSSPSPIDGRPDTDFGNRIEPYDGSWDGSARPDRSLPDRSIERDGAGVALKIIFSS
jgi:hypothetical protein